VDAITGETITYQYDALKRLLQASGKNWGESYVYDGYGNLTQMNPTGTAGAPSLNVSVALDANNVPTNRISATGVSYDNNGNQTLGFGGVHLSYDAVNRVGTAMLGSQSYNYGYDSDNRRIYSRNASGTETIYFYGVDGKKLATYTIGFTQVPNNQGYTMQLNYQSNNVYFVGRLISAEGGAVRTDRLGSVRSGGPGGLGYQAQYPYGVEYTLTANDREKYATYTRDSLTGLDYAMNRYYSSQWGRFLSPDPYGHADLYNPPTWNQNTYVGGDPVNGGDPLGLCTVMIAGIAQAPSNDALLSTATALQADSAYPYQGESKVASIGSVIAQAFGPNDATTAALNAINYALASNTGSVDIIAYSGGAAAFTAAFNSLSSADQARIGLVLYLSPGVAGTIAARVVTGSSLSSDPLAMVGTTIPLDVPSTPTSCDHTDYACLRHSFWATRLISRMQDKGACSNPEVFTRTSPKGVPGYGYQVVAGGGPKKIFSWPEAAGEPLPGPAPPPPSAEQ
jgi:RHS repeat-associated protein